MGGTNIPPHIPLCVLPTFPGSGTSLKPDKHSPLYYTPRPRLIFEKQIQRSSTAFRGEPQAHPGILLTVDRQAAELEEL